MCKEYYISFVIETSGKCKLRFRSDCMNSSVYPNALKFQALLMKQKKETCKIVPLRGKAFVPDLNSTRMWLWAKKSSKSAQKPGSSLTWPQGSGCTAICSVPKHLWTCKSLGCLQVNQEAWAVPFHPKRKTREMRNLLHVLSVELRSEANRGKQSYLGQIISHHQ